MTTPVEFIVLHFTKIKDNAIVVHTLSREYGRRSFLVSIKAGASMSLFLPLNILEAEIVENSKSQLWRAKNIISKEPLMGIRQNIHKNNMTLFMSEVLFKAVFEGVYEDGLYEWCRKAILELEALNGGYSEFNTKFMLELCIALGFAPAAEDLEPFTSPLEKDNLEALLRYLSYHLDTKLNIQSLKVLRELYAF